MNAGCHVVAALLLALLARSAPVQDASPSGPTARWAAIAPGERQTVPMRLTRGDYLAVEVASEDVLLALRVIGVGGKPLVDLAHATDALKQTAILADTSGDYRIEIEALGGAGPGTYRIDLRQRTGTPGDATDVAAWRLFDAAEARRAQFDGGATRVAISAYEAALQSWCLRPCAAARARALGRIGDARLSLGESAAALAAYDGALRAAREASDAQAIVGALNGAAAAHLVLGHVDAAERAAAEAVELSRALSRAALEAWSLNTLGDVRMLRGDTVGSLDIFAQALSVAERAGSRRYRALSHLNLGYAHWDLSHADQATAAYEGALALWTSLRDPEGEARTRNALGHMHAERGQRQQALADYRRARDLFERMGHRQGLGISLNGLGYVYSGLGDLDAALDHYEQQARVHRAAGFREGEGSALAHIGRCQLAQGRPADALASLSRGLVLIVAVRDRKVEAFARGLLGLTHEALGDTTAALEAFERSRALAVLNGDRSEEAYALNGIARMHQRAGRFADARQALDRARALSRDTQDRAGESLALYDLARLDREQAHLDDALANVDASLAIADALRADVASFDLRASFVASMRSRQETQVDLLMALHAERPGQGFERRAFDAAERARARSLLEALAEPRRATADGADPQLRDRETALRQELRLKADRLARLGTTPEARALAIEVDRLRLKHDAVDAELRAANPRYAAMTGPGPLSLTDIQARVLDRGTTLLQFFVGEQRSYLWAVRADGLDMRVLPGRPRLEALVRAIRQGVQPGAGPATTTRIATDAAMRELADVVLSPLSHAATRDGVVLVAPDGPLHFAPFGAFPLSTTDAAGEVATAPLLATHQVVYVPSLSTVGLIRGRASAAEGWTRSAAIFADPVFEADDPRLAPQPRRRSSNPAGPADGTRRLAKVLRDAAGLGPGTSIPRLVDSRGEARAIQALLPDADVAIDFEANRGRALARDLTPYRVVHFATHALVDDERPELSGIVLSLYDPAGRRQDGILRLSDIYGLSLRADLVVLSACSTAVGKQVAGEGLLGLGRGFMHAGSRRVLATLWNVDDEASGALMARFYARMFKDGLGPAAALRQAQLEIAAQPRWAHPRFWAGFVLIGDWQEAPPRPAGGPEPIGPDRPDRREHRRFRDDTPGPRAEPPGGSPQAALA